MHDISTILSTSEEGIKLADLGEMNTPEQLTCFKNSLLLVLSILVVNLDWNFSVAYQTVAVDVAEFSRKCSCAVYFTLIIEVNC